MRRGKECFYRLAPVQAGLLDLGAAELAHLALCRNLLLNLLPENALPAGQRNKADDSGKSPDILYKGYIDYGKFELQYNKIQQAIQRRIVCRISYRKSIFQPAREFWFAPMRIVIYREAVSALGWEVSASGQVKSLHANWLWLYIQRLVAVTHTRRSSAELPDIALQGEARQFGIMAGEPFRVKLLFNHATANYVYDRKWAADQIVTIDEDDGLILEMTVRSKPEIISWILSFGPGVRVLEPDWLREEIRNRAFAISAQYEAD